jgi:hypothetical protein
MLVENNGLLNCTVFNPLWLIAGPKKKTEAEILQLIEEGWGVDPVHPNMATYEKLLASLPMGLLVPLVVALEWKAGVRSLISQSGREPASLSEERGPGGTTPTPTGENSRKGTDLFMSKYAEWREPPSDCLCDNTYLSRRVVYSSERTSTRLNLSCFHLLYDNVHARENL